MISHRGSKKPLNARSSFTSQKGKVLPGIHLNTWKYNVWGIKLETKVMCLHKIQAEDFIASNKYAVQNFGKLPVVYQV